MRFLHKFIIISAVPAIVAGCADTSRLPSAIAQKLTFDPDSKLGMPVQSFVMDDKRKVTLRQNERHFLTLKVDGLNPITIGVSDSAKIYHQANVNGATAILIERNEQRCPYHYQLVTIQGNSIGNSPLGSCTEIPVVTMPDKSKVDYLFTSTMNGYITKTSYRFSNGNLLKDIQTAKIGTPTPVPSGPQTVTAKVNAPSPQVIQQAETPPATKKKPNTPKTKPLVFKESEDKPVKVDLKE